MGTSGSDNSTALRARALLFSGRPDPEWPIDSERAAAIVGLLEAAPATDAAAPAPPPLGYRGVHLSEPGGVSWLVYSGVIVEERPRCAPSRRIDAGRRVERAALATAPPGTLPAAWLEGLLEPPT